MKVFGTKLFDDFSLLHADVRGSLDAWRSEVEEAIWQTPHDVQARFPSVSFINKHAVFNIKGNRYRLDTLITYNTGLVLVKRLGTHEEYARWAF